MNTKNEQQRLHTLTLAALGVVYGDIGTSPLYALKEVFASEHHPVPITTANVLGILSLFLWSLLVVVTMKYVLFIMRANNKGEGGIIALMTLALRDLSNASLWHKGLFALGLCGAALFYGDGVITPAISVLSAVEGLRLITPGLDRFVLPITLAIVITLFWFQSRGTAQVGKFFGPCMIVWFIVLAMLGIGGILRNPTVLAAVNPWLGVRFLWAQPVLGFFALGAVVLCITGAEALYADMGHFGVRPIQRAWLMLVLPALLLNYFGQGALLLADARSIENPFYLLAPDWALTPLVVLSTLATVIASQAVISGVYSISRQAMQLGLIPRLEVRHTSAEEIGQIYLPLVNWGLLAAIVVLILTFRTSSNLAAAYGIAVTGTMLVTDVLAFTVAVRLWGWHPLRAALGTLPFILIDGGFFLANSIKIVDGGWFPLVFGGAIYFLLTTWKQGRDTLRQRLAAEALPLLPFAQEMARAGVHRVPGTAIFLTPAPDAVPHALLHSLKHYQALHEQVVVLSVHVREVPYVDAAQRVRSEPLAEGFLRVYVDYGFKDDPDIPAALAQAMPVDAMRTSYFIGRETLIPALKSGLGYWRRVVFAVLFRNAGSATAFFKIPANRVVELGSQIVL